MKRFAAAVAIVAALSFTVGSALGGERATPAATSDALLGIVGTGGFDGKLVRFDPSTLRRLRGVQVALAGFQDGWSFSPGHQQLVLGFANPSCVGGSTSLRFVDPGRMRMLGDVPLVQNGAVEATAWPDATHVLAVVQESDCLTNKATLVFGVNAQTMRVTSRTAVPGDVIGAASTGGQLVLLLGPPKRIGTARLAVVEADGKLRTTTLGGIQAGIAPPDPSTYISRTNVPGLAVDGAGHAFVVPANGIVAEVDLATLTVGRHALHEARSLLKGATGPARNALWLGNGLLAVTGWNFGLARSSDGSVREQASPAGLELVDTRTWKYRQLDKNATRVQLAGDSFFVYGDGATTSGLSAYSLDGRRRYRLFVGKSVSLAAVIGGRGYADLAGNRDERIVRFATRTGKLGGTTGTSLYQLLLGESAPFPLAY
jgi:hypothetical protein